MTTLQKTNLMKWRKVTSIQNKKPWKIKKTKCQEISDAAAAEEILNPKKMEVKEETKAKRAKKTPLQ